MDGNELLLLRKGNKIDAEFDGDWFPAEVICIYNDGTADIAWAGQFEGQTEDRVASERIRPSATAPGPIKAQFTASRVSVSKSRPTNVGSSSSRVVEPKKTKPEEHEAKLQTRNSFGRSYSIEANAKGPSRALQEASREKEAKLMEGTRLNLEQVAALKATADKAAADKAAAQKQQERSAAATNESKITFLKDNTGLTLALSSADRVFVQEVAEGSQAERLGVKANAVLRQIGTGAQSFDLRGKTVLCGDLPVVVNLFECAPRPFFATFSTGSPHEVLKSRTPAAAAAMALPVLDASVLQAGERAVHFLSGSLGFTLCHSTVGRAFVHELVVGQQAAALGVRFNDVLLQVGAGAAAVDLRAKRLNEADFAALKAQLKVTPRPLLVVFAAGAPREVVQRQDARGSADDERSVTFQDGALGLICALSADGRAFVREVVKGSQAAQLGVHADDVIVQMGEFRDLRNRVIADEDWVEVTSILRTAPRPLTLVFSAAASHNVCKRPSSSASLAAGERAVVFVDDSLGFALARSAAGQAVVSAVTKTGPPKEQQARSLGVRVGDVVRQIGTGPGSIDLREEVLNDETWKSLVVRALRSSARPFMLVLSDGVLHAAGGGCSAPEPR
jgi:hypothetical protein